MSKETHNNASSIKIEGTDISVELNSSSDPTPSNPWYNKLSNNILIVFILLLSIIFYFFINNLLPFIPVKKESIKYSCLITIFTFHLLLIIWLYKIYLNKKLGVILFSLTFLITYILIVSSFCFWYEVVWSSSSNKSESFNGLVSFFVFLILIATLFSQIYQHKKNLELTLKNMRKDSLIKEIEKLEKESDNIKKEWSYYSNKYKEAINSKDYLKHCKFNSFREKILFYDILFLKEELKEIIIPFQPEENIERRKKINRILINTLAPMISNDDIELEDYLKEEHNIDVKCHIHYGI